ncbi:hypothetical protein F993_03736 [Acinetobacter proteolyticus]|jgi:hypothetical protein|uniref:DUF4179 domain-containing protein n=2 Tax=Acinetobacter proteolyticus TaxID=1776741 RepID=A0A653K6V0_9GAMM|nr:hypothetical protein [Acinetobacter proteolyticus]QHH93850.1 DUF4179 domain-containing protein [Acinetobacter gyllenbergii]ENU21807.1 hypothetical protein F993_03736 [Acinetobacter proteolyticus]OEY93553.1 peptide signal protein [Acinetobacter proteolyticus]WEI19621.1 DUF4179 domain-containing protein [Acinetobacter proteolyticus]VXA56594.1 conserved exported hypothetical protein [Acinetobacter proteolyticus]
MRALKLKKALGLSLFLAASVQMGHAAAIKESNNIKSIDKSSASLIVKALDQQKRNTSMLPSTDDELKMLNTIRTTPTQTFFASQHERFSRFVQTIFQPHTS